MNTNKDIEKKLLYLPPIIESIKLDNEISLAMQSLVPPPGGPGPGEGFLHENFNNDPYKQFI